MSCKKGVTLVVLLIALSLPFLKQILEFAFTFRSYPLDAEVGIISPINESLLAEKVRGKTALVVGGTRGIGRGIAIAFAKYGANVIVVGRNGEGVLDRLTAASKDSSSAAWFRMQKADLLTVKGVSQLVKDLEKDKLDLDFLVFTVGTWPNWEAPQTTDKVDKVIALDVFARIQLVKSLVEVRAFKQGARVLNVLASTGSLVTPPVEDMKRLIMGSEHNYSLVSMLSTAATANDVVFHEASKRFTDLYFVGTHPGFVMTNLTKSAGTFPEWFESIKQIIMSKLPISQTEEESGEVHLRIITSPNMMRKRATFFNWLLQGRFTTPFVNDDQFSQWLWSFCEEHVQCHR